MDEKKPKEASPKEKAAGGKEKADGKAANAEQPKAPQSNKMLFIGIIAGVLVVEAVLGIVFVKATMPKPISELEAKMHADSLKKAVEENTSMGKTTAEQPIEVVVNIAGTDGERFLKAAVVLEYEEPGGEKEKKGGGEGEGKEKLSPLAEAIIERMPKYKSFLIENLSKMTLAEITAPDAKEKIRKDFLRIINNTLPSSLGEVRDVYFTQFIIQ